jgi:2-polyprenyl-3-methyl-5-hydroxy-6-metoxy-1,4-benzoquinol methylase
MKPYRQNDLKDIRTLTRTNSLTNRINDNYFNKNFLLRWIFWKRVDIMINMAAQTTNPEKVLDFGTGWGVLLPSLSRIFNNVYGVDIDVPSIDLASQLVQLLDCKNVQVILVKPHEELLMFRNDSFNCIIVADVLEHVSYFSQILLDFKNLLTTDGSLIVSVPTENLIYRSAKKLLRHPPSCDKHVCSPKEIEETITKNFVIKKRSNLFFFKIFDCQNE